MSKRNLVVISAGLSQPSSTQLLATRLAQATQSALEGHELKVSTVEVDLREYAHDIVNNMLTGFAPSKLDQMIQALAEADGVIAVTPTFNASYSGLFKSFFDVLPEETLAGKNVLIAATGGTARHSLALEHALRPMFAYLRAVVVPVSVYAAPEDWAAGSGPTGALADRIHSAATQLADLMARAAAPTPPDPFALTTTFDQLLRPAD